ncbi:MAG: hypothetical protein M3120_07840 [Pseudomonadota bacterium]|nr:hypothetical protein [Pseudomonadota bacterium]
MRNKLALVTAFLLAYGGIAYATQQGSTARGAMERKEMKGQMNEMKEQTDTTKDKMKRGGQNAPTSASTRSKEAPVE